MINNKLRSLFAGSVIAVATTLGFTTLAQAQNADVQVTGIIPLNCVFSNNIPGQFGYNQATNLLSTTTNSTDLGLTAQSGSVDINCNGASTLEIRTVTATSAPTTASSFTATVSDGTNTITSLNGITNAQPDLSIPANSTETIDVDLEVNHAGSLSAGTYTYTVTLTANP